MLKSEILDRLLVRSTILTNIFFLISDSGSPKNRFLRVQIINRAVEQLRRKNRSIKFLGNLLITPDVTYIDAGGIFLNTNFTNRYLKTPKKNSSEINEGKDLASFLENNKIIPKTFVDVGANVGEITFYFAKHFPKCDILAIEPSTENYNNFLHNYEFNQKLGLRSNIKLAKLAVSDHSGKVDITVGQRGENSIIIDKRNPQLPKLKSVKTERVPCDRIDSVTNKYGFKTVDFMKIDIEGAEPYLKEGLIKILPVAMFMELSNSGDTSGYEDLINELYLNGYESFNINGVPFENQLELINHLRQTVSTIERGTIARLDCWFIRQVK